MKTSPEVPPENVSIAYHTWDGSFRETFHTAASLLELDRHTISAPEFVWADFHQCHSEVESLLHAHTRFRCLSLENQGQWHAGICINAAVEMTESPFVAILDGDLVIPPQFHQCLSTYLAASPETIFYARRFDEPDSGTNHPPKLERLAQICQPAPELNFGGFVALSRKYFEAVGGCETHPIFGGPGSVFGELASRLVNAGYAVQWPRDLYVYHPWHTGTLPSIHTDNQRNQLTIIQARRRLLSTRADEAQIDALLAQIESVSKRLDRRLARIRNKLAQLIDSR